MRQADEPTGLRELWDSGRPTVGGWCAVPSGVSAEVLGVAGFDWVAVDTQHGLIGYDQMQVMVQALSRTGTPAFVRVPWNEPAEIMKALDAGAQGVIVPMVNSPEEARIATGACRYPPQGIRSWGPTGIALRIPGYNPEMGNRLTVCAIMVETAEAVDRIDEIVSVPGVDAVFIGPNDLAISLGLAPTADPSDTEHLRRIDGILAACRAHRVAAGIACGSARLARQWAERGFTMLAVPSDAALLRAAAEGFLAEVGRPTGPGVRRSDGYT
jgi:4-hydroxy-2-oxoheptanedioate aldolase